MISELSLLDEIKYNSLGLELNEKFAYLFSLKNYLNKPYNKLYGYKINNFLVGFVHFQISFNEADIINIVVDKNYRKQNIATKLINYGISKNNLKAINIEVKRSNPAVKFYEKLDFKIIRTIKNYYEDNDAYFMKKV